MKSTKSRLAALEAKLKAAKKAADKNDENEGTAHTDLLAQTEFLASRTTDYSKYSKLLQDSPSGGSSQGGSSGSQYLNEYAHTYAKYAQMPKSAVSSEDTGSKKQNQGNAGTAGTDLLAETKRSTGSDSTVEDLQSEIRAAKRQEERLEDEEERRRDDEKRLAERRQDDAQRRADDARREEERRRDAEKRREEDAKEEAKRRAEVDREQDAEEKRLEERRRAQTAALKSTRTKLAGLEDQLKAAKKSGTAGTDLLAETKRST